MTERKKLTDSQILLAKTGLKKVEEKDIKVTNFDAPDDEPVELVPCLFVGSLDAANNHQALQATGITHVLTLSAEKKPDKLAGVEYSELLITDNKDQKLDDTWTKAFSLIDGVIASGGSILVHGVHGQSRIGAICIGYLMSKNKQPWREVWRQVKDRRSKIHPSEHFQEQLTALERKLGIEEKTTPTTRKLELDLNTEEEETVVKKPKQKRESRLSVMITAAPTLTRMVRDRTPAFKWDAKSSAWQEAKPRSEEEGDDDLNDSIEEESEIQTEPEDGDKKKEEKEPKKITLPLIERKSIKVLTYNILFADRNLWARFKALADIVRSSEADLICLQEVRVDVLKRLETLDWVREHYYVSDHAGFTLGQYGVFILSRLPIDHFVWYPIPSNEQKRLLRADFNINGKTFSLINGQYDSGEDANIRHEQLTVAKKAVGTSDTSLLVGDYNFDTKSGSKCKESEAISDYTDVWRGLHPSEPGYTVDSSRNSMFLAYGEELKGRYDRFYLKSSQSEWTCKSIKLVGDKPIITEASSPRQQVNTTSRSMVFPSHHFGLLAEFTSKS